jgi:hypothetical protein
MEERLQKYQNDLDEILNSPNAYDALESHVEFLRNEISRIKYMIENGNN